MKNKVKVTIVGSTKSGKSRIAYIIKESLRVHGLDVTFDPSPDFVNEPSFNRTMRTNFDECIKTLSEQTEVEVVEHIDVNETVGS